MLIVAAPKRDQLVSRLCNWKFAQALQYTEGQPSNVVHNVSCLANLFGNPGWFDGEMGTLVSLAVLALVGEQDE